MRIDYQKVKAIAFEELLAHYNVELKPKAVSGDQKLVGRCPIHTDGVQVRNRNHFQVTVRSDRPGLGNTFHCFACGARGSVIDFTVLMEKLVDVESVDWEQVGEDRRARSKRNWCPTEKLKLASRLLHVWFLEDAPAKKASSTSKAQRSAATNESEATKRTDPAANQTWVERWGKEPTYSKFYRDCPYLDTRGIRAEVLAEFGVGYYANPKSRSSVNYHILFPIENDVGELVGFAWRSLENEGQRYCFPPKDKLDRSLELWNLHRALKRSTRVFVVEGFFSCLNLWQHGVNAVALMGSTVSAAQTELLCGHFDSATFLIEPEKAGQKLKRQVVKKLLPLLPVRLVEVEKDPDEMTAEELAEALG